MLRRIGVVVAFPVLVALVMPTAALAVPPDHVTNHYAGTIVVPDLCPFPVTVAYDQVGTEVDRYDTAGNLIGMEATVTERDTYSATHTLVSAPYTFHVGIRLDKSGELVQYTYSGLLVRFALPDGGNFVLAGAAMFPSGDNWIVVPDHGVTGDVDALCAALGG